MKLKNLFVAVFAVMLLTSTSGCTVSGGNDANAELDMTSKEATTMEAVTVEMQTTEVVVSTEEQVEYEDVTETQVAEENTQDVQESERTQESEIVTVSDDAYVGTYNDYDNDEPNLTISLVEDGTYHVVIGIFRLAVFDDGIGTLTEKGLEFTATDSAGNPIAGVITREGEEAVVIFTDSTWDLIANGTAIRYRKAN